MKGVLFFFIALFSLLFWKCSTKSETSEKLVAGVYCGNCVGGTCAPMLVITETVSGVDTSNDFFFNDQSKIFEPEKIVWLPDSIHRELKKLLKEIPSNFNNLPEKTGSPDAIDQCGYYISNGKHFSRIDPGKCPGEIKVFIEKVKSAAENTMHELRMKNNL